MDQSAEIAGSVLTVLFFNKCHGIVVPTKSTIRSELLNCNSVAISILHKRKFMASSSTARVLSESTRPNTTSSASASAAAAMEVDQDAKALGSLTFPYNSLLTELREEISASLSKHPTVDKLAQNVKNSYQILVSPRAMISDLIRAIEQLNSKASNALTKDLMKIISQPKYDRSKFVNGWEQLTGNIEVMLRTRKRQRENEEKLEKDKDVLEDTNKRLKTELQNVTQRLQDVTQQLNDTKANNGASTAFCLADMMNGGGGGGATRTPATDKAKLAKFVSQQCVDAVNLLMIFHTDLTDSETDKRKQAEAIIFQLLQNAANAKKPTSTVLNESKSIIDGWQNENVAAIFNLDCSREQHSNKKPADVYLTFYQLYSTKSGQYLPRNVEYAKCFDDLHAQAKKQPAATTAASASAAAASTPTAAARR